MHETAEPDYYEILQISVNAEPDTVHRVYRLLAQRFHPDNKERGTRGGSARSRTIRNRTSASPNARNRSRKSGFIRRSAEQLPLLERQLPGEQHAIGGRQSTPVREILPIGVGFGGEARQ